MWVFQEGGTHFGMMLACRMRGVLDKREHDIAYSWLMPSGGWGACLVLQG